MQCGPGILYIALAELSGTHCVALNALKVLVVVVVKDNFSVLHIFVLLS